MADQVMTDPERDGDGTAAGALPRRAGRRDAALGAAGLALGAGTAAGAASSTAYSYARIVGANDRVRVGVVGYSDRFRASRLPIFGAHGEGSELRAGRRLRHLEAFDYGPLTDRSRGFQVVFSSRMTNAAGEIRERYYSNGGMLDLDTNEITPTGGLSARLASEMQMKANLLPATKLSDAASAQAGANTGADPATTANVKNWFDRVRDRKPPNADIDAGYNHSIALCMAIAAIRSGKRVTFNDVKQDVVIA